MATHVSQGHHNAGAVSSDTVSISPSAAGNVLILAFCGDGNPIAAAGVSGVASTWTKITGASEGLTNGTYQEMWYGTGLTTGAGTVTVTFAGAQASFDEIYIDEYSPASGTGWAVGASGILNQSAVTAFNYPNLTSPGSGSSFYHGVGIVQHTGSAGSTSGFTYYTWSFTNNEACYNVAIANSTAYQPAANQNISGTVNALGIIMQETGGGGSPPVVTVEAKVTPKRTRPRVGQPTYIVPAVVNIPTAQFPPSIVEVKPRRTTAPKQKEPLRIVPAPVQAAGPAPQVTTIAQVKPRKLAPVHKIRLVLTQPPAILAAGAAPVVTRIALVKPRRLAPVQQLHVGQRLGAPVVTGATSQVQLGLPIVGVGS